MLTKHRLMGYSEDTTARWGKLQSQEENSLLENFVNSVDTNSVGIYFLRIRWLQLDHRNYAVEATLVKEIHWSSRLIDLRIC